MDEKPKTKYYVSPVEKCDICKAPNPQEFVDGAMRQGPWAIMCMICFPKHGVGLGSGLGQHYKKDHTGGFAKQ
jgi:hypothetical protein